MMKELQSIFTNEQTERLLAWYRAEKRDLPWRATKDPYRIWISEIMLQQTRVEAVKPYYERFLATCPTVFDLAELDEERLMKLWEGLGYYSRARNLQKAARTVVELFGGVMPTEYDALLKLSGIGDYTAGAVASIAYDVRVPAVDGNVLRVLSRLSGSYADIADPVTKKSYREALLPLIPPSAGDFNQALIELGATVCVPNGEARCNVCPMRAVCVAAEEGLTNELPVRAAKRPRRIEEMTVLIIRDGNRTVLHKRPLKGLLAGLYELPNVGRWIDERELPTLIRSMGFDPLRVERLEDAKHIFSHVEWHMQAYAVTVTPEFDGKRGNSDLLLVQNDALHRDYAIPSAFSAYTKYL